MTTITYGKFSIDFDALPLKAQEALISRGITHYLGNEQASKVSAWANAQAIEKLTAEGNLTAEQVKALTPAQIKAAIPSEEARNAKKDEYVATAHVALLDGSLGSRTGGPKADPLTRALRQIAEAEVIKTLKNSGYKPPKGKETITIKGVALTMAELITRRIESEKFGPDILKAAKAQLAAVGKLGDAGDLDDL